MCIRDRYNTANVAYLIAFFELDGCSVVIFGIWFKTQIFHQIIRYTEGDSVTLFTQLQYGIHVWFCRQTTDFFQFQTAQNILW